tara:strand:+ start:6503 stop:6979 length:477 start_codon:yes stop_codon:yes gene_type:complete
MNFKFLTLEFILDLLILIIILLILYNIAYGCYFKNNKLEKFEMNEENVINTILEQWLKDGVTTADLDDKIKDGKLTRDSLNEIISQLDNVILKMQKTKKSIADAEIKTKSVKIEESQSTKDNDVDEETSDKKDKDDEEKVEKPNEQLEEQFKINKRRR